MGKRAVLVLMSAVAPIMLAACGGGDSGDAGSPAQVPSVPSPPASSAEGVYGGTLTGSTSSHFRALILENGEFWSLYGRDAGSIFYVEGLVQGVGSWNQGSFTSSNVKDFGFYPAIQGTLTSTYQTGAKTISGTVTADGGSVQFSGGPIPGATYNYESAANLSTVSGRWDAMSSAGGSISINVSASGSVSFAEGGCTGSGSISPRPSGKNVFNVSLTFGAAPCAFPNQTATGVALAYPLSTGQTQFIAGVTTSSRTAGLAVFGIR